MIHNQQGFTYPLTLSLLIIFLFFLSIRYEQLLTERKIVENSRTMMKQEYYLLLSVNKISKSLQSGNEGILQASGSFAYREGKVNYQVSAPVGSTEKVTFTLLLNSGETRTVSGYFNLDSKKLVKWVESN